MDEWIARYSTPDDRDASTPTKPARTPAKKSATRKATKTTKRTTSKATRSRAAKSTGTLKKAAGRSNPKPPSQADVAPDRGAIGSNPERRFSSDASRGLAPKR